MSTGHPTAIHPLDEPGGSRFIDQIFPNALVTWVHKPRGGYGYTSLVPASVRVVHRSTNRVTIAAELASGGVRHVVVDALSLRWRKP